MIGWAQCLHKSPFLGEADGPRHGERRPVGKPQCLGCCQVSPEGKITPRETPAPV